MMYKALCSEIHTKHPTHSEHHVEIFIVKPGGNAKKPLGFRGLLIPKICTHTPSKYVEVN